MVANEIGYVLLVMSIVVVRIMVLLSLCKSCWLVAYFYRLALDDKETKEGNSGI